MQVFRGDRSCPSQLQDVILHAVDSRLSEMSAPPEIKTAWRVRVANAIKFHNNKKKGLNLFDAESVFHEMLVDAEKARVQFIITYRTLEEQGERYGAKSIRELLTRNLHLYASAPSEPPKVRYTFCLPNEEVAKAFWRGLRESITTEKNPTGEPLERTEAGRRLQKLATDGFLCVWTVPSFMCGSPMVVFNPDEGSSASAYSFCFHPNNQVSIMKFDDESLANWHNFVFRPFRHKLTKVIKTGCKIMDWKKAKIEI